MACVEIRCIASRRVSPLAISTVSWCGRIARLAVEAFVRQEGPDPQTDDREAKLDPIVPLMTANEESI